MARIPIPLDSITVASPCSASWDDMRGDHRARLCQHCHLHVYNLSSLTRRQAEDLVQQREGRVCVHFYRRNDGTLLTRDCPVGMRAVEQAARRGLAFVAAGLAVVCTLLVGGAAVLVGTVTRAGGSSNPYWPNPTQAIQEWLAPPPASLTVMGAIECPPAVMGEVCIPPRQIEGPQLPAEPREALPQGP